MSVPTLTSQPFLALLVRSMRLQTRGVAGVWIRLGLAGLVLAVLLPMESYIGRSGAPGLGLLTGLFYCAACASTLAGISWFSSAITEEKDEGNMGLLTLAGLTPLAILLAKSTARLWEALLALGVLLPLTVLAVSLGGVSLVQVLACFIGLAAYLILLSCLGLLVSVISSSTRRAASLMFIILLLHGILPAMIIGMCGENSLIGQTMIMVLKLSVLVSGSEIMGTGFSGGMFGFQVAGDLVVAGLCFFLAWWLFPRFALDEESGGAQGKTTIPKITSEKNDVLLSWRSMVRELLSIGGRGRATPGIQALAWKELHYAAGGKPMVVLRFIALVLILMVTYFMFGEVDGMGRLHKVLGFVLVFAGLTMLVVDVGLHLAHMLADELREQTASSLALLPYSLTEIVSAKARAIPIRIIPAMIAFGFGCLLNLSDMVRAVAEILTSTWGWNVMAAVVLFWALCLYFSTVLRHGAVAAAVGTLMGCYVVEFLLLAMMSFGGGHGVVEVVVALSAIGMGVIAVLLVSWSLARYRRRLSEG